jgi:hypothetical protein
MAADQEQHSIAPTRCLVQRPLPSFPGDNPTLGIQVKEQIVPTVLGQPVAQGKRFSVIAPGVAEEK